MKRVESISGVGVAGVATCLPTHVEDSLAHLRLVMEAEAAFGGEIPLADIPTIGTLGELRDLFTRLMV